MGGLWLLWLTGPALAGPTEELSGAMGADRFQAGASVVLAEPVDGDALLAGGSVDSDASIGGDATVAGGTVAIRATVGDDLYAAGGRIEVDARIGGNVRLAGGSVTMTPQTFVEGGAAVAGGTVEARGHFGDYLTVAGDEVTLGAEVDGDVRVYAHRLTVLPGTRIGGTLRYRASDPVELPPDVVVGGGMVREDDPAVGPTSGDWDGDDAAGRVGWIGLAGLLVVGALLAWGLAGFSQRTTAALIAQPWLGLGLGFVVLVCTPVLVAVLVITLVGIPLAVILLLTYLATLIAAYVLGALYCGDRALAALRLGAQPSLVMRLLGLFLVLVALALASGIPVLGSVARLVVLLLGLGGIALALRTPRLAT
ncbi:MAG: hypothetical protein IT486_07135 [Gammaproteobacteria bacterium]|nr:hypothetical protein [Gammaproteobacteria bacterium]